MRGLFVPLLLLLSVASAQAGDRVWLGKARIFSNDKLGDGQDRWRSGSYAMSFIRGSDWNGTLPAGLGDLMEYRIRTEIIAPANLITPAAGDRRYVGALSFGSFSHLSVGKTDVSVGLDMVVTGPQTVLGRFQSWVHTALGMGTPTVLGDQIGNAVYPTLNAEFGRDFVLPGAGKNRVVLRPFAETQLGVETFVRLGGDLTFGPAGEGDFQVRDSTTGHRSIAIKGERPRGMSFLLGGDVAQVFSSQYLQPSASYTIQNPRVRLRAGIYSEMKKASFF